MLYDDLVDFLDGREFNNRKELAQSLSWWADDRIEQIRRLEYWAREQANPEELDIKIKDN